MGQVDYPCQNTGPGILNNITYANIDFTCYLK